MFSVVSICLSIREGGPGDNGRPVQSYPFGKADGWPSTEKPSCVIYCHVVISFETFETIEMWDCLIVYLEKH